MTTGDHIFVDREGRTHHGIDVGGGLVIHVRGEYGTSNAHRRIRYATLDEFSGGAEIKVRKYDQSFGPDQIVRRAESRLGERDFHLSGRHGEHFASWCAGGPKVNDLIKHPAASFPAGRGVVGGALGSEPGRVAAGMVVDAPGRTWSLRREWSRAFTFIMVLLLASAAATIVGVQGLVGEMEGTTGQLHVQSETIAALRSDLVKHEQLGHRLLSNEPVDRLAFVKQQQVISRQFDHAAGVFPNALGMRDIIIKTQQSWQNGLMASGLWGEQLKSLHGNHAAGNAAFDTANENAGELLGSLEGPSHKAMDQGLAHEVGLERILIVALIALFALASAVTVYFRLRMAKDLMRPVARMHEGVLKLQAGDYDHRIQVARQDELGELAGAFNDMATALHESHLTLTLRATHDSLTGLANRAALRERLTASFSPGTDCGARQVSLLFIDIDDFKDVNDSVGHEGGDALLVQLATRLNGCVRAHDLVVRLGGDEFAIVVTEDDDTGSVAVGIAGRIHDALQAPFIISGDRLVVTLSIGVAQRRPETEDASELVRQADFAMYMAKGGGKARYQLFDAQMHDNMLARSALKTDLAGAVVNGQLRVEYQPVVDLFTGQTLGVEALVRWQHPTLGLLGPDSFIALAEETGDIDAIGCWVLDAATRQVASWRQSIPGCADLWVAVNLSAFQLADPKSLAAIQHVLADSATQADKVVIEVTETALAANVPSGIASLNTLKDLGVRISIDDFGTGFSSLSTLASMPVDVLKIDRSFVSGQASALPSVPMLEGILGLANKLSLAVIAEGIEEPEQLNLLRALGCDMGQGYLLARPAPAHELEVTLASAVQPQPVIKAELGGLRLLRHQSPTDFENCLFRDPQYGCRRPA
jgi:diguanylate cyclase (GGDEF)-like protein